MSAPQVPPAQVRCISRESGLERLVSLDEAAERLGRFHEIPADEARRRLVGGESIQTISFIYRIAEPWPPVPL